MIRRHPKRNTTTYPLLAAMLVANNPRKNVLPMQLRNQTQEHATAQMTLALALLRRGRMDRAEVALVPLAEAGGFRARCMLGELRAERGRRDALAERAGLTGRLASAPTATAAVRPVRLFGLSLARRAAIEPRCPPLRLAQPDPSGRSPETPL